MAFIGGEGRPLVMRIRRITTPRAARTFHHDANRAGIEPPERFSSWHLALQIVYRVGNFEFSWMDIAYSPSRLAAYHNADGNL